jgi:hypothetical protein
VGAQLVVIAPDLLAVVELDGPLINCGPLDHRCRLPTLAVSARLRRASLLSFVIEGSLWSGGRDSLAHGSDTDRAFHRPSARAAAAVDRIGPVNLSGDRRGDVLERLGSLDGVQSARSGPDGDSAADDGDLTGPDVGGDDITWRVTPEPTDPAPLCVEGEHSRGVEIVSAHLCSSRKPDSSLPIGASPRPSSPGRYCHASASSGRSA